MISSVPHPPADLVASTKRLLMSCPEIGSEALPMSGELSGSHHWRQDPDDFENNQWLEILRTFATAENLYLSKEIVPRVAPTLELVTFGKRLTEVVPSLQNLFLEGPYPAGSVEDAIGNFSTARRRSGCPIVIHDWDGRPWSDSRRVDIDD